ncbi:hypothetical protein CR513_00540, partial [Mucuna pruriens]
MKRMFLEKFFLASRIVTIWKEIYGIKKHSGETLHEYWERFNKLCATCPHHQISEQLLLWYFYKGLMMMDRNMIDATSGGALMDKTPTTKRHMISNISNTQQFRTKGGVITSRVVNEVGIVDNLSSLLDNINRAHNEYVEYVPQWSTSHICAPHCRKLSRIVLSVGAISGYQYGRQSYPNRSYDSQQYWTQQYQPSLS